MPLRSVISTPILQSPVNTWAFDYDGFQFGNGTPYQIISIPSGWSRPPIRIDETEFMASHGSYIFGQYLQSRTWQIQADFAADVDSGEFGALEVSLRQAFGPKTDPRPLTLTIPSLSKVVSFCIPELFDITVDQSYSIGYAIWTAQLRAADPRLYTDPMTQASVTPEQFFGYSFNYGFPYSFGGGSSGVVSATNIGTFDSPPVMRLHGPFSSASIAHLESGRKMAVNLGISASDYITIDAQAHTIMVNDVASRYDTLVSTSQWFNLIPGTNTLVFVASGGDSNTLATVYWRSAWI